LLVFGVLTLELQRSLSAFFQLAASFLCITERERKKVKERERERELPGSFSALLADGSDPLLPLTLGVGLEL
jgi:hypothetical protein